MNTRRSILSAAVVACLALWTSGPASAQAEKIAARTLKFELYKDAGGEFRWRLKAGNGEVIATAGQGYKRKADAATSIDRIIAGAGDKKHSFEIYEDKKGEYRWRLKASNGQVVAVSSEGYSAKADAEKAVELVKTGAAKAKVDDQTG